MFLRSCHGHVQLAVYQFAVLHKCVVGKEPQLVMFLNGKSVDDITTLTALKAFYRVDGDVVR